jgi:hypothetical protein
MRTGTAEVLELKELLHYRPGNSKFQYVSIAPVDTIVQAGIE